MVPSRRSGRWASRSGIAASIAATCLLAPSSALAWTNLGVALANEGRCEEAGVHYRRALSIHPTPLVHANLARCLHGQGRMDEAVWHMREAQRLQAAQR